MAYRPTSLDFINRPNPVEPQSVRESNPLNARPRLDKPSKEDFLRRILDDNATTLTSERPAKRRKSGNVGPLDLPKLPAVKNGAKRMRIPPTLSGLHHPPPDAGLLPSISVEQPVKLTEKQPPQQANTITPQNFEPTTDKVVVHANDSRDATVLSAPKSKRNKWSEEETADLLKGVARFGIGSWTRILRCPDYSFKHRTAIDLKDRFRVCCPDEYQSTKKKEKAAFAVPRNSTSASPPTEPQNTVSTKAERKSSKELRDIGIKAPFEKSKRRPRTAYTATEDEALLKGFTKYNNSWASIQHDPELGLQKRKPTDLRDRFRTKFPERYREAGLAPRPEEFPKKPDRASNRRDVVSAEDALEVPPTTVGGGSRLSNHLAENVRPEKENKDPSSSSTVRPKPVIPLLQYDDVFWGAPLDDDDTELTRPTLDRRILDWPFDIPRPSAAVEFAKVDIDTLLSSHTQSHQTTPAATSLGSTNAGQIGGALPSLAAITAGVDNGFTDMEQLELPTLIGVLGNFDYESRSGGQFPSLDELLS